MSGQPPVAGKVLVLGSGTRAVLAVIRSLGRRGIEVHLGWETPGAPATRSCYLRRLHRLAPYSPLDDRWKHDVIDVLRRERFDLVIPCVDLAIIPLQTHRKDLEPLARIALLNDRAFEVAFDKHKTGELALAVGVPVPRELRIGSVTDVDAALARFAFPLVLKPLRSYEPDRAATKNEVVKAYDHETLWRHATAMLARGEFLMQENVVGKGVGVAVLADRGEILYHFQHVRIHEPLHGGGSSYRKGVPTDPALLDASRRLLKALDYTGVALVEFKVDDTKGTWVLMEINGRFWGSLPLAVASGADFPFFLYQRLVHGTTAFPGRPKLGLYGRNTGSDLKWLWTNVRADRRDRTLATEPLTTVLLEARHLLLFKERNDTIVSDDPLPGLAELAGYARRATAQLAALVDTWSPRRRTACRRMRHALASARRILFVCKGNVCRSPFAERYIRPMLGAGFHAASCGYYPAVGRACPPDAQEVAEELGVPLAHHRSRVVSRELVQASDLVLVFDAENRRELIARFPDMRARIFPLAAIAPSMPLWIHDPYGRDKAAFRACYRTIAQVLDILLREWTPGTRGAAWPGEAAQPLSGGRRSAATCRPQFGIAIAARDSEPTTP
jgi:protein-tyrosine-phosphatase/predicted ATP-grasp superfamily ATP-dependent carboligase